MDISTNKLNWEPVLNGAIFCSSQCGCGCTKESYDEAHRLARELADRMGEGWEPHVWENGRWDYAVFKGVARIHPGRTGYSVYLNTSPQFITEGANPIEALKDAQSYVRGHMRKMQADLDTTIL